MAAENIVQAEFFHVGGPGVESLDELFNQCQERLEDNLSQLVLSGGDRDSGIKTVVRFNDQCGVMTSLVSEVERLEKIHADLITKLAEAKGLRRWFLGLRGRRLHAAIATLKEESFSYAIESLGKAFYAQEQVAIEIFDHRFRLVRADERHELLESVGRSKGLWVFVFIPNDLLSDRNRQVTYMM